MSAMVGLSRRPPLLGFALALLVSSSCIGSNPGSQPIHLRNGDLSLWNHGATDAPEGWTLSGPGEGTVQVGTSPPGGGAFSAVISARRGDMALFQDLGDLHWLGGRRLRFTALVRSSQPGAVQLSVNAGPVSLSSPYHSGSGEWELLTATGVLPVDIQSIRVHAWARKGSSLAVSGFSATADLGPPAGVRNLDLSSWTSGAFSTPDGWILAGGGEPKIRQIAGDAPGSGHSALISSSGGDALLYQVSSDPKALRNHQLHFSGWVKTDAINSVEFSVHDGSHQAFSPPHSGSGKWELLTVDSAISRGATLVRFQVSAQRGASLQLAGNSILVDPEHRLNGRKLLLCALTVGLVALFCIGPSRRFIAGLFGPGRWQRVERLRRWLTPERFLLLAGSLFGLCFLVTTPPLETPDEPVHLLRAFVLSEGQILPTVRHIEGREVAGANIPVSLFRMMDDVGRWEIPFHADRKFRPTRALEALTAPLLPSDRRYTDLYTMTYAPVPYIPQAFAISLGRLADASPLMLLYLARLSNLVCWLCGMWLAIRLTPLFKWPMALLALTPMSMFLAASASPDVATNWLSFVVIASFLNVAFRDSTKISTRELGGLLLLCLALSLCKQVYLVLSLLLLMVPSTKLGGRARAATVFAVFLGLQLGMNALWAFLAIKGHPTVRGGSAPSEQLAFILADPLRFVMIFLRTHAAMGTFYLSSFIGNLGWLDVVLPTWLILSYAFVILAVSGWFGLPRNVVSAPQRLILFSTFAIGWAAVLTYHYLIWSKVGAPLIDGGQGRYLIPVSVLPFLAIAVGRIAPDAEPIKLRLAGYVTVVLAVAVVVTAQRFY